MIDDDDTKNLPISKSQRKRDMAELQTLGEKLLRLKPEHVKKLDLPDTLMEALGVAQRVPKHEAMRRHVQYIGRLMRDLDEETVVRMKRFLEALK